jgi:type I restriction enzyme S subunit
VKEGWSVKQLSDFMNIQSGFAFKSGEYTDSGHFLVRIGNVQNGYLALENPKYVSLDSTTVRFELQEGDFLTSLTGNIGRVARVEDFHLPAALNQRVARLTVRNQTTANKDYVFYILSSNFFKKALSSIGHGAAQQNVSPNAIGHIKVPLPPLPEQKRMAAILNEAFEGLAAAVANAEKNFASARELFDSYLNSVFTKRGAGWVDRPLGSMCERITKGSSPKWQGVSYVEKAGILFVTSENVGEYQVLIEKPKYVEEKFNIKDKKSILKKGDVLTNIVGASIGRTAVFDRDDLANINQAVCLIRCEPNLLNNCFLTYLLNSRVFKQVLHDNEVDNARANLSLGFFSQLLVPTPPLPEQRKIVSSLDSFREETQRLEAIYQQKLDSLAALKESILQKAFAGELPAQSEKALQEAVA